MVTIITPLSTATTDSTICQKPFCYNDTRKILKEDDQEEIHNNPTRAEEAGEDLQQLQIPWDDDNFSLCLESFPTYSAQMQKVMKSYPTTSSPLRRHWVSTPSHSDEDRTAGSVELEDSESTDDTEEKLAQNRKVSHHPVLDAEEDEKSIVNSSAFTCPTLPGFREEREELQAIAASSSSASSTLLSSAVSTPTVTNKFMRSLSHSILKRKRTPVKATTSVKVATLKKRFETYSEFPYNNSTTTLLHQPPSPQQHHQKQQQAKEKKQYQGQQQQKEKVQSTTVSSTTFNHRKRVEHISPLENSIILNDKNDIFNSSPCHSRRMSTASSIHSSDRFSQRDLQQQQGDGWKVAQQSDRCSVKSVPTKTSPTSPTTAYYTNAPLPLRYSPTPKLVPSAPRSLSPSPLLTPKNNRHLDPLAHRHHTQAQSRYGEQPKPQPQPQLQASANLLHHQSSVPSASSSAPYQPYNHALSYHYEEASEEEPKKYQLSDPPASSLSYSSPTTIDHSASSSPVPSIADMSTHTNATSTNDSASKSIHSVPVHTNNADKLIFYNEIYESRRPYSHYFGTPGHDSHQRYLMNNSSSSSSKKSGNKKSTKNGKRYSSNEQNHYQVYNNSKKKSVGLFTKLMKSLKHRFISG